MKYQNLTNNYKYRNYNIKRLYFAMDKDKNVYSDFYFDKDEDIKEEIEMQKILEELTNNNVYLNPKTFTSGVRTPDYWIKETNELWDLKCIDGNSKGIIDSIFHKCKNQTNNVILKKRKTSLSSITIVNEIKRIFDKNKRTYIKQVMFFDENENLILYLKRK